MGSITPSLYSLADIQGKGKGLIAEEHISQGTQIIDEPALFTTESLCDAETIERDLGAIVKRLPRDDQRRFLSLHNNFPGPNPFSNIIRSNGYPLGPSSDVGGVFPETARINHSCRPNAQHAWNDKLKRMLVHAVRDISPGEEITLSYIPGGPANIRRATLKTHFGFDCHCELCSLPSKEQKQSDQRLEAAQKLDEAIGDSKRVRLMPNVVLGECRRLLQLYKEEQIFDLRLPRLYYDAFQICAMHGDQARASVFAGRARQLRVICEGEQSVEADDLKKLEKDPRSYENFGLTMKWKSQIEDIPGQEDKNQFENWLWKATD